MSYTISAGGKVAEALSRLSEQSAALTYLTGVEKTIKDKAIEFASASLEALDPESGVSVSISGGATSATRHQKTINDPNAANHGQVDFSSPKVRHESHSVSVSIQANVATEVPAAPKA